MMGKKRGETMAHSKKFFSFICDFRWMSLVGIFAGIWLFLRQTMNLPFFTIIANPYLYLVAFIFVMAYRVILWIIVEQATTYTLRPLMRNIFLDYFCFTILMLCSGSACFLLSLMF